MTTPLMDYPPSVVRPKFKPICPLKFANVMWPDVRFYNKQKEIIIAVEETPEVFVYSAKMSGKDYVAGYIALSYLLRHPEVRVITTSVKDDHLRVLWGEIERFVQTCAIPLPYRNQGPLTINHKDIRKHRRNPISRRMEKDPISYLRGMVSEGGEGLSGHHAEYTLAILDECSGISDMVYEACRGWAKCIFAFGNPNPCTGFYYKAYKQGDILAP